MAELARELVRPPELLMVGSGLESTRETVRLSREAVNRGADLLLILTPNYYKSRMTSPVLVPYFRAVADGVRRPIVIYNIPQFTGIRMEPAAVASLSRHPNIAGLKESSGDLNYLRAILRAVKEKGKASFRVLSGGALIMLDALRAGAAGGVLAQANFAPELCVSLYEAFRQGQMKTARELQRRLVPLVERISVPFGVSGIKAALDLRGYRGGPPRPPLIAISASDRKAVAAAIQEARAGLDL
jgi:4-hydroxy-2-oxoglutarate aldolase